LLSALGLTKEELLASPSLGAILTYHVLPSRQDAAAITAGGDTQATLYAFPGTTPATLAVDTSSGVKLTDAASNTAAVTTADVAASNGVIHVIDKVLVPPGVLTVVQMAQTNPNFSVLVEAVVAAGLADDLSTSGPFTVFAPTNDAFVALLSALGLTKEELLASPSLGAILTYHVVAGKVMASDVVALPKPAAVTTLQGATFSVGADLGITDGAARTATLLATDVVGSNGVIHVLDKVLVPPGVLTVVQVAQTNPNFSILVEAVVAAGLADDLSTEGPFTVFAPTNDAFVAALGELGLTKDELLASPSLGGILTYHVVAGKVMAADVIALPKPAAVPTLQGSTFSVGADLGITDGRGRTAMLVATDVVASNGVIHVIDKVLLPPL
jgi:transforming growth factor-beta-induced protein